MSANDPKRTFSSTSLPGLRSGAAQTIQFSLPNLCFQSLITPGGNSRVPTPVRRQASGHISSNEWSSRNSSLWETWSAAERGHRSAAIFRSSMSVATSCCWAFMTTPFLMWGRYTQQRMPLCRASRKDAIQRMPLCWASQKDALGGGNELLQPSSESAL